MDFSVYGNAHDLGDGYAAGPGPSTQQQQQQHTWSTMSHTVKLEQPDHHEGLHEEEGGAGGKAKPSKRVRLSCAECRRLKLRCSRTWPCTACVRRDCASLCPEGSQKTETRHSRQREIAALLTRVQELEGALAIERAGKHGRRRSSTPAHGHQVDLIQAPVDAIGHLSVSGDERSRYLGPSSASAHLDRIDAGHESDDHDLSAEESDAESFTSVASGARSSFPFLSSGHTRLSDYLSYLPSYAEAKRIADVYYDHYALYEPLQRDVFEKLHLPAVYAYKARCESEESPTPALNPHRLAVLFAVLAMGSLFDLKQPPRSPKAELFFSLSHSCLASSRFLAVPTLAAVQTLHLLCVYTLNSHKNGGEQCWPLLGLAVRLAQAMGLHRDPGAWKLAQPEADQRRLLWAELVVLDGLQALTLGRPCATDERHRDTLLPTGEGLRWTKPADVVGNNDGERGTFHRAKWRLIPILSHIVERAFSCHRASFDTIMSLDRELRECMAAVPDELKYRELTKAEAESLTPQQRRLVMQSHAITVKMNETLLFLHRAYFVAALQTSSAEPLRSPYAASVIAIVLEASKTLSDVARSAHALYPRNASRQWTLSFHAYGGGVCVATLLLKSPGSLLARFAWKELDNAVALLEMSDGAQGVELLPRLRKLRENARRSLQAYHSGTPAPVPSTPPVDGDVTDRETTPSSEARPSYSRTPSRPHDRQASDVLPGLQRTAPRQQPLPPVFDAPISVEGISPAVLRRIEELDSSIIGQVDVKSGPSFSHYASVMAQCQYPEGPPLIRKSSNSVPTPPLTPSWAVDAQASGWPNYLSAPTVVQASGYNYSYIPSTAAPPVPSPTVQNPSLPSPGNVIPGAPAFGANQTYSAAFPPSIGSAPGGAPYGTSESSSYAQPRQFLQHAKHSAYGSAGGYHPSSVSYVQPSYAPAAPQQSFDQYSMAPTTAYPSRTMAQYPVPTNGYVASTGEDTSWFGVQDGVGDGEETPSGFGSERPYEDMLSYAFSGTPAVNGSGW